MRALETADLHPEPSPRGAAREMLWSCDMRSICAMCAIALVALPGCFLSHGDDVGPPHPTPTLVDAAVSVRDAGWIIDDAGHDAGYISPPVEPTFCGDYWMTLPWCPASPVDAIGQSCDVEGARCGADCCEPGPAIVCDAGRWRGLDVTPDCRDVLCEAPTPCGLGACAGGSVCVRFDGLRGGDSEELARCVVPRAPIHSCGDAPTGSVGTDPGGCFRCVCDAIDERVRISLDCPCC